MLKYTGIIGCGSIGEALIPIIQGRNRSCVMVSSKDSEHLRYLQDQYGVCTTHNNRAVALQSNELYICVRPEQAKDVCTDLKGKLRGDTLVISVMAGISLKSLRKWLDHDNLIKIIPTITLEKEGPIAMTGYPSTKFSLYSKNLIQMSEEEVDLSATVNGCMPGFMAYLLEEMISGAINLGMDKSLAEQLVFDNLKALATKGLQDMEDLKGLRGRSIAEHRHGIDAFEKTGSITQMFNSASSKIISDS